MQRIYDRRTQRTLGMVNDAEFAIFRSLLLQPSLEEELPTIDPSALERMDESGVSDNLRFLVRQVLDGSDQLDLGWAPADAE